MWPDRLVIITITTIPYHMLTMCDVRSLPQLVIIIIVIVIVIIIIIGPVAHPTVVVGATPHTKLGLPRRHRHTGSQPLSISAHNQLLPNRVVHTWPP